LGHVLLGNNRLVQLAPVGGVVVGLWNLVAGVADVVLGVVAGLRIRVLLEWALWVGEPLPISLT
jgi:hypothetical protein